MVLRGSDLVLLYGPFGVSCVVWCELCCLMWVVDLWWWFVMLRFMICDDLSRLCWFWEGLLWLSVLWDFSCVFLVVFAGVFDWWVCGCMCVFPAVLYWLCYISCLCCSCSSPPPPLCAVQACCIYKRGALATKGLRRGWQPVLGCFGQKKKNWI